MVSAGPQAPGRSSPVSLPACGISRCCKVLCAGETRSSEHIGKEGDLGRPPREPGGGLCVRRFARRRLTVHRTVTFRAEASVRVRLQSSRGTPVWGSQPRGRVRSQERGWAPRGRGPGQREQAGRGPVSAGQLAGRQSSRVPRTKRPVGRVDPSAVLEGARCGRFGGMLSGGTVSWAGTPMGILRHERSRSQAISSNALSRAELRDIAFVDHSGWSISCTNKSILMGEQASARGGRSVSSRIRRCHRLFALVRPK